MNDLRDRIAAAIYEHNNPGFRWADAHPDDRIGYGGDADAVMAVLPAPVDPVGDGDRLQNKILELEAELAKVRDLLRTENKRANDAISREETAEQAALEAEANRAAVLREAADAVQAHPGAIPYRPQLDEDGGFWWDTRDRDAAADLLRRMADEAQQPEEAGR